MKIKKLFLLAAFAIINGSSIGKPMFPSMILRCDDKYKNCRWECEWGVHTSTAMIEGNYLIKPDGCLDRTVENPSKGSVQWFWNNNQFIPTDNKLLQVTP